MSIQALALAFLAFTAIGGIAWVFVYPMLSGENKAEARRASVEAGRTDGWWRWVGERGLPIGVDTFGASAPAQILAEKYGLTGPQIADKLRALLSS